MTDIVIIKEVFDVLKQKIDEKGIPLGLNLNSKAGGHYGFKPFHAKKEGTIKSLILRDMALVKFIMDDYQRITGEKFNEKDKLDKAFLIFNGKYLYDRNRDYENNKNPVLFTGIHTEVYFKLVGANNIHEFLEKNDFSEKIKKTQKGLLEIINNKEDVSPLATEFQVFYYNSFSKKVSSFFLYIDFLNNYFAKAIGFHSKADHDNPLNYEYAPKYTFTGNGLNAENYIMFNLAAKEGNETFMNISLRTSGIDINSKEVGFTRGILTTMSVYNYLLSTEVFMVKREGNSSFKKSKLAIEQYLMIEQRNFILPNKEVNAIPKIKAKNYNLGNFQQMVGKWRLWSVTKNGHVYQSAFIIDKNFYAILKTKDDQIEDQKCTLRITKGGSGGLNLCVSALHTSEENRKDEIQNFAIIKVVDQETNFTSGIFSGIGTQQNNYTIGPIALFRDDSGFNHKQIKKGELGRYISESDKVFREKHGENSLLKLFKNLKLYQKKYKKKKLKKVKPPPSFLGNANFE